MKKNRLLKVLLLCVLGFIPAGIFAADEVSQEGVPYKAMLDTKVHLGEMVKKGQILFTVKLAPLEVEKKIDENNLIYTKEEYKRDVFLKKNHAVKFHDYLKAKADYLKAVATLKKEILKIKHGTDKAPFDGEVTKIVGYTGSATGDGNEVLDVTKTDKPIKITKPAVAQVMNRFEQPIKMDVKLGQKVKKGQLLFSTDAEKFKLELSSDDERLKLTEEYLKNITKNFKTHAVSQERYEKAKNIYADALQTAKTDVEEIKESKCYAPFDGVVTKIVNYTGSTTGAGNEVLDVTKEPVSSK
jgi:multidrug resistance efflux pump